MVCNFKNEYKRFVIHMISLVIIQSLTLFLSFGSFKIQRFWYFLATQVFYTLVVLYAFQNKKNYIQKFTNRKNKFRSDSELINVINFQMVLVIPLFIGLDFRFQWFLLNTNFILPGLILLVVSNMLILSSMIKTSVFERCLIQFESEFDNKKSLWPYSIVRHPGYLGTVLWFIATPLLLGSFIGLFVSYIVIVGIIIRTYNEDDHLLNKTEGYKEYAKKIKYRLLPGIW